MNKTVKWVLIGLAIAVVAFGIALCVFIGTRVGFPKIGRLGLGGYDRHFGGMMIGLGLVGMLFRMIFPLGFVALAVLGLVSLVRGKKAKSQIQAVNFSATENRVASDRLCMKCTKPLETDWVNCPYCGKKQ
ncbi:MAG: hypothetical protein NTZ74_10995 [Chloroflexi bacterium]|nr:hypothetical protein [Chloroflexota bacterium]